MNFTRVFFPHDNKKDHFKSLDGLRGFAVLIVLLSHASNFEIFFHKYLNFQQIGKIGVYLFFVLSAYLIDRQIAIKLYKGKATKSYWLNYMLRRFLRIYPLYALSLCYFGFFSLMGYNTVIDTMIDLPMHLALLKGESIFWSIPVEFKYYLISPFIMLFCQKCLKWDIKRVFILLFSIIALTIIFNISLLQSNISTLKFFPIFLVGTAISIYEIFTNRKYFYINKTFIDIGGLLALAILFLTIPFYFNKIFSFNLDVHSLNLLLPFSILWGIILISCKYGKNIMKSIFEIKLLRFLGTISYSMYLLHEPILSMVCSSKLGLPDGVKIYVFFFIVIIISSLSYLFIEKPLSKIRYKNKKLIFN